MENELDLLLLFGLFPEEQYNEIITNSNGNIQNAANNLQWNFVKGLIKQRNTSITLVNSLFIGSFPKRYKKLIIKTSDFWVDTTKKNKGINVGFINLPLIKRIFQYYSVLPYIKDWADKKSEKKRKFIICYAMTSNNIAILKMIKHKYSNIGTCLIVPDLPQYMSFAKERSLYSVLKYFNNKYIMKNHTFVDSHILLTKQMAEYLGVNKYLVIEGIVDDILILDNKKPKKACKTVLYTGGLSQEYGVKDLVDSFKKIPNENFQLILCGDGALVSYIKDAEKDDHRIVYKGQLPRNEILLLQRQCTLLVNPRKNNCEFTKYSFPSKVLEYMQSETPVLVYRLDGMPTEYFDYLYLIDDYMNLESAIINTLEKPQNELSAFGKRACLFVKEWKNSDVQCSKIVKMFECV